MHRILDIAFKDLSQLVRDRKIFLFFLIMPVALTLLFGFAFGGFSRGGSEARLPVGFLDEEGSRLSRVLHDLLAVSEVIRLEDYNQRARAELEARVAEGDLVAAIIVPVGYGHELLHGRRLRLVLIADTASSVGTSVESEVLSAVLRLENAVRTAIIMEQVAGDRAPFDYAMQQALSKWEEPPIRVHETTSSVIKKEDSGTQSLAHTSPGMMLQFAIAGLLTSAQIIVSERKSRALQRLLTTPTARLHILLGHYLAIFILVFCQFLLLISFGQFLLGVNYLSSPLGTLLVAFTAAVCIAALGLLIGVLARNDEQAIIFSLVPMFVLAGLGGAMVPLEVAGPVFQIIGHASPVAWAMDGFMNIIIRGLGVDSVLLPATTLIGYGVLFFSLAVWRFRSV